MQQNKNPKHGVSQNRFSIPACIYHFSGLMSCYMSIQVINGMARDMFEPDYPKTMEQLALEQTFAIGFITVYLVGNSLGYQNDSETYLPMIFPTLLLLMNVFSNDNITLAIALMIALATSIETGLKSTQVQNEIDMNDRVMDNPNQPELKPGSVSPSIAPQPQSSNIPKDGGEVIGHVQQELRRRNGAEKNYAQKVEHQ